MYRLACEVVGIAPIAAPTYWRRRRRGASTIDVVAASAPEHLERFRDFWLHAIEEPRHLQTDRVYRHALQAMEELTDAGHRLVLVTLRKKREALLTQIELLGIGRWFDLIMSPQEEADNGKMTLIGRTRHAPGDVMVGDSEVDITSANALGMWSVAVSAGVRTASYLSRFGPTVVVSDIGDVPAAVSNLPHQPTKE